MSSTDPLGVLHGLAALPHYIITEVTVAAINTPRRQIKKKKKVTAVLSATQRGIHTGQKWHRTATRLFVKVKTQGLWLGGETH